MKNITYQLLRSLLLPLAFIQRLPLAILFLTSFGIMWGIYKVTKAHPLLVSFMKGWVKIYFFLQGIKLIYPQNIFSKFKSRVLICNYTSMLDNAVMFVAMPYKTLIILPEEIFEQNKKFKSLLHLFGFYGLFPFLWKKMIFLGGSTGLTIFNFTGAGFSLGFVGGGDFSGILAAFG